MKKIIKALKLICAIILFTIVIVACEKDYNTIGSDIVGNKNFVTNNEFFTATAYNKKLDPIQTNGLPSNLLGVNNDPVYGSTTASIVSQMLPQSYPNTFGENVEIDSVVLSIPYFNKVASDSPDDNGNILYSISDSLYGEMPIKLSVFRSDYYLRSFDPNSEFEDAQIYYSNANSTINFDNHIVETLFTVESFVPSSDAIPLYEFNESTELFAEKERLTPRLRLKSLDLDYWKETIINKAGTPELSNQNNFTDYFRGVYFKAEAITPDGNMILLNMGSSSSNIIIYYSKDSDFTEGERETTSFSMLLGSGIRLNTFENTFNIALEDGDTVLGDEKLYLKGGEGSMAIIDLFGNTDLDGNGISDELEEFKSHKDDWLINEASLVFYEDETMTTPTEDFHKYDRVYLFDVKNNLPVKDYFFDPSANDTDPFSSRIIHLGQRLPEDSSPKRFKIRITEYVTSLLENDSTNTKLGLSLSTNVNIVQNTKVLNGDDQDLDVVPAGSTLSPKGTVLYGSNSNVPEDKRVRLEIYYTEPTN